MQTSNSHYHSSIYPPSWASHLPIRAYIQNLWQHILYTLLPTFSNSAAYGSCAFHPHSQPHLCLTLEAISPLSVTAFMTPSNQQVPFTSCHLCWLHSRWIIPLYLVQKQKCWSGPPCSLFRMTIWDTPVMIPQGSTKAKIRYSFHFEFWWYTCAVPALWINNEQLAVLWLAFEGQCWCLYITGAAGMSFTVPIYHINDHRNWKDICLFTSVLVTFSSSLHATLMARSGQGLLSILS